MTEKTVPSLVESLGQAWRMMKVSWSYSCRPQTDGRHTALTEEGLRILHLKLALEYLDPATGFPGLSEVMT